MNYKKDRILCTVLSWQNYYLFVSYFGRHVSIIFSIEIIIFHYLPLSTALSQHQQRQTNLYLLRSARHGAPLFEGDFVTTLHFIGSNDQTRRQTWITSFPSDLSYFQHWMLYFLFTLVQLHCIALYTAHCTAHCSTIQYTATIIYCQYKCNAFYLTLHVTVLYVLYCKFTEHCWTALRSTVLYCNLGVDSVLTINLTKCCSN